MQPNKAAETLLEYAQRVGIAVFYSQPQLHELLQHIQPQSTMHGISYKDIKKDLLRTASQALTNNISPVHNLFEQQSTLPDDAEVTQSLISPEKQVDFDEMRRDAIQHEMKIHASLSSRQIPEPLLASKHDVQADVRRARQGVDVEYVIENFGRQHSNKDSRAHRRTALKMADTFLETAKTAVHKLTSYRPETDPATLSILKESLDFWSQPTARLPLDHIRPPRPSPLFSEIQTSDLDVSAFESEQQQSDIHTPSTDAALGKMDGDPSQAFESTTRVAKLPEGSLGIVAREVAVSDLDMSVEESRTSAPTIDELVKLLPSTSAKPRPRPQRAETLKGSLEDMMEYKHVRLQHGSDHSEKVDEYPCNKQHLLFKPDEANKFSCDDDLEDLNLCDFRDISDETGTPAIDLLEIGSPVETEQNTAIHSINEITRNEHCTDNGFVAEGLSTPLADNMSAAKGDYDNHSSTVDAHEKALQGSATSPDTHNSPHVPVVPLKRKLSALHQDDTQTFMQDSLSSFMHYRGKRFKQPGRAHHSKYGEILDDPIQSTQISARGDTPEVTIQHAEARKSQPSPLTEPTATMVCHSVLRDKPGLGRFLEMSASNNFTLIYRQLKDSIFGPDLILNLSTCLCLTTLQSLSQRPVLKQNSSTGLSRTHDGLVGILSQYEHVFVLVSYPVTSSKEIQTSMDKHIGEFSDFCRRTSDKSCSISPLWLPCSNVKETASLTNNKVWELIQAHGFRESDSPVRLNRSDGWTEPIIRIESSLREAGLNPFTAYLGAITAHLTLCRARRAPLDLETRSSKCRSMENAMAWLRKNVNGCAFVKLVEIINDEQHQ